MTRTPFNGRLYDFLQIVKNKDLVNIIDLEDDEIEMAEELVRQKLLAKIVTRLSVYYTYGGPIAAGER